jgi:D-alanyl-D-alanine carboxypeptidase
MKKQIFALALAAALLCTSCSSRTMESSTGTLDESSLEDSVVSSASDAEPSSDESASSEETDAAASAESPSLDDWRLVLVNPWNVLDSEPDVPLVMTSYGYQVDERIVPDLDAMINAAADDGVSLLICYGYRTFAQSQALFEKQVNRQLEANPSYTYDQAVEAAKLWVAPPGTSDHHTGLALDIVTPSNQVLDDNFANTDAAKWMEAHGWEYGFVIRFPADKTDKTGIAYESWHLRYVGRDNAAIMHEKNYCLEEYVEAIQNGEL